MLGLPSELRVRFRSWSEAVTSNAMNGKPAEPAVREAVTPLREYLALAIERRRRERGDDLISALVAAHEGAEALRTDAPLALAGLPLAAGTTTTTTPDAHAPPS